MKVLRLSLLSTLTSLVSFGGVITYTATLSGPAESPPNASPGTGFATIVFDTTANTLAVNIAFTGLLGTTTASHIHCCTALSFTGTSIVATETPSFPTFPTGVTSGTDSESFDLTLAASYNPAFITASGGTTAQAEAALLAGAAAGEAYLNIHTSVVPGGEIRGFLLPVPEPATIGFSMLGLGGLLAFNRKRAA